MKTTNARVSPWGGSWSATPFFHRALCLLLLWPVLAVAGEKHGFNGLDDPGQYDNNQLTWRKAEMTWYESYPSSSGYALIANRRNRQ